MAGTRNTLARIEEHVLESMGKRDEQRQLRLSPVPHLKDTGRRPLTGFGCVDIDQVVPDPRQPRAEFDRESIERLAASLQEQGQLAPIRVRWCDDIAKWVIIAGERRWRASRQAGLSTIECYCHEGELARSEVLEQQLIENLLREDLKPIEEARAFSTLMEINGWNGKQVAAALRLPASKVSRSLTLLTLPTDIQQRVEAGELPARSAYELSKLSDAQAQRKLADRAAAGNLTHDQTARAVRQRRGKRCPERRGTQLTFFAENGWKVAVSAGTRGNYHDVEQALQQATEEVQLRINNNVQLY